MNSPIDLTSHQFIASFEPQQAAELCQVAVVEIFPSQEIIFEEGEISDCLYLVLAGQVEFRKRISADKYKTVALAKSNDFFGELGVLDGEPRSTQAIACGETILAKIPRNHLMEVLNSAKGSAAIKVFSYMIQGLRNMTEKYVNQLVYKEKMVLVGEMVNTIIHDFKSPFTGIQLASYMLKELHPDRETQEWCDIIQAQNQRMFGMAEDLLEFSRGSSILCKQPINLAMLLQQFEKLNNVYFKFSDVEFMVQTAELVVNADENKLMRVLQNLVGNAVDAFGGRNGRVEIIVSASELWAEIKISDNGPGIPEAIRESFFEPFVTYGKRGGTGLGTAIAKSIIDAHDGEICFETYPGEGTTFYIRLPLLKYQTNLDI